MDIIPFDVDYWEKRFLRNYEDNITYFIDDKKHYDSSSLFKTASKIFNDRGYLKKEEFISIGVLRAPRARKWFMENSEQEIRDISKKIINKNSAEEMIEELTRLKGVGTPVATTVITVLNPKKYCTYSFRSLRTLIWINNNLKNYQDYHQSLELIRKMNIEGYKKYLKKLKNFRKDKEHTLRELEIALEEYDKNQGKKPSKIQQKLEHFIK